MSQPSTPTRRTFFQWLTYGMGALATVFTAVPLVGYFSPLPCTRGRGAGVRGSASFAETTIVCVRFCPPHPRPLSPEYSGEGGTGRKHP
jgi:hypothetical protein